MIYPETKKIPFEFELCGKKHQDPYQWLETVHSEEIDAWVTTQNNYFLDWVRKTKDHDRIVSKVKDYLESDDKIPYLKMFNGYLYHFNHAKGHDFGFLRRAKIEDYKKKGKETIWELVFDLDQYNKNEKDANWIWRTISFCEKSPSKAIITLSDRGKDESIKKEFDLNSKEFVSGGIFIPLSKFDSSWSETEDSVYSSFTTDPKEKSEANYSLAVRRFNRDLNYKVDPIFVGGKNSVYVYPSVFHSKAHSYILISEKTTFFKTKSFVAISNEFVSSRSLRAIPISEDDRIISIYEDFLIYQNRTEKDFEAIYYIDLKEFFDKNEFNPKKLLDRVVLNSSFDSKNSIFLLILKDALPNLLQLKLKRENNSLVKEETLHENPEGGVFTWLATSRQEEDVIMTAEGYFLPPTNFYLSNSTISKIQSVKPFFNTTDLVFERVEVSTSDGVKFPVDIVRKKDMKFNGDNPCILNAYGGFNITKTPLYDPIAGINWFDRGGVYAIAHIRGGGDFGSRWHEAGRKEKREIVFRDLIDSAKTLIENKITNPKKLAIRGGSNGGLLVGSVMVKAPELFAAVVSLVPLIDMLRYVFLPPGSSWIDEYGDPRQMPDYEWISAYSPYQNIKENQKYPNVLFQTSSADDRVHPSHARKIAALMQSKNLPNKVFLYEGTKGGHSMSGKLKEIAEERSLNYSFLRMFLMD